MRQDKLQGTAQRQEEERCYSEVFRTHLQSRCPDLMKVFQIHRKKVRQSKGACYDEKFCLKSSESGFLFSVSPHTSTDSRHLRVWPLGRENNRT